MPFRTPVWGQLESIPNFNIMGHEPLNYDDIEPNREYVVIRKNNNDGITFFSIRVMYKDVNERGERFIVYDDLVILSPTVTTNGDPENIGFNALTKEEVDNNRDLERYRTLVGRVLSLPGNNYIKYDDYLFYNGDDVRSENLRNMVGITDLHETFEMEESRQEIGDRLDAEEAARILGMLKMGRVGGKKTRTKTNKRRKKSSSQNKKRKPKTRKTQNKKK